MEHMIEEIKWKHLYRKAQLLFFSEWKTLLISMAAIVIYAVGVVGFTIPYKFADQGVMGIAVLLKYTLGLNPAYVLLVLNIILLAWGARTLSKRFLIWTVINAFVLSAVLDILQTINFPIMDDIFLVAVAGGVIKGLGIGLLYRAGDGATLSLTGTLLVMTSSLSYAIYIVGVNRPSFRELPTLKVTFYVLLFGLSLFLVRLDFGSAVTLPGRWYLWGNLVALALFPTAISFLCTTSAIQYIGSTPTAILGALEPVTAVFFGVTIFGEQLTPRILCGMLLIIVAVSLIVAGNRISATLVRFRKLFPRIPLPHLHRRRQ